jgi:phage baseplate assembly protein W
MAAGVQLDPAGATRGDSEAADRSKKAFLGVGWAFPVGLAADGAVAMSGYEEDVRQAILIILGTNPGERVMRPDFGAGLNAFVFEPVNPTSMARISGRVREALTDFEPRIEVNGVTARRDPGKPGVLLVDIKYRVRLTNTRHNLVYPFYLEEGATA